MFRTVDAARAYLEEQGLGEFADRLIPMLRPCLMLASADDDRVGGARIGGRPDFPPHLAWPVRAPITSDKILKAGGGSHAAWIAKHASMPIPFEFVAQIDLTEAARFAPSAGLPEEGRLLFFYDGALGPWQNPRDAGRVIWDKSPLADLAPRQAPDVLLELEASERAEYDHLRANPMELAKNYAPAQMRIFTNGLREGQTLEDFFREVAEKMEYASRYVYPSQPMRIESALQWPDSNSPEAALDPDLQAFLAEDQIDDFSILSRLERRPASSRHVLYGTPIPDQDDPRYDTALAADPLLAARLREDREATLPTLERAAADWRLLLQVDQAALQQARFVEGIFCFVIHINDLGARDFTQAQTIYQQT